MTTRTSKGTYVWVDVSPYGRTNGPVNVYRNHYWRIRPNDNGEPRALCWRYRGITAPQANTGARQTAGWANSTAPGDPSSRRLISPHDLVGGRQTGSGTSTQLT